ncbi:RCC1 domain-containing protein 1 isoform X2 [Cynoglossus semilaevis]|uniref:RCC1 domain-containing protein 1 isoform X2 n=1 Tax=Cynoglossus semilaevis TaxID=244447 RepID=UPI0004959451|nr:RCC1 domain-containing protein 1 isoform X2 [Cynoglossus semilaevis]
MRWFGFGFNAFEQICVHGKVTEDAGSDVKVTCPTELKSHVETSSCCLKKPGEIRASWSRRASLHLDGDSCVCLAGFVTATSVESCGVSGPKTCGCTDAVISEYHLTLTFPGRVEVWDIQKKESTPKWSMEINTQSDHTLKLPLVPGGYITNKPPFYHSLSPCLKAKSLALGAEHALLLCVTGDVYTWGLGSHGQLGHGGLTSEEEPRAVEALCGMPMSSVATGGWHSVCISAGGDLYVWGWNESGQLGLPSQGVRKALQQNQHTQQGNLGQEVKSSEEELQEVEKLKEFFISIQAFPALLDVTPSCEIKALRVTSTLGVGGNMANLDTRH